MSALVDPKTGQVVKLPSGEAEKAILEGKVGFFDDKVDLVTPAGRRFTVPTANVNKAIARGARLVTDEERDQDEAATQYDNLGGAAIALGTGAARTLTAGASDFLGSELSSDPAATRKMLRQSKEVNPGSSFVGEMAGTVGSLATGAGVPALVAKAGAKTTAKLGGKVLAKAAGTALEGGILGLGTVVSEEYMKDKPALTAEKLFAGMAAGGLMGGGLSLTGSAIVGAARGGSALLSKMGGRGMRDLLEEHANKLAIRQYARPSDLKNQGLTPDEIQKVGKYGLENGLFGLGAGDTAERAALKKADEWAKGMAPNLAKADAAGKFDVARFTARATQEIIDPMVGNPALSDARRQLSKFVKEYQQYGPNGGLGPMTFAKAWDLQRHLREKIGMGEANHGIRHELAKLRDIFRNEILDQADSLNPGIGGALRAGSRKYRNASVIARLAKDADTRSTGHRITSVSDLAFGLGGLATFGPGGVALGVANHLAREYGGSLVSSAMHKLARGQALVKVGAGFHKFVNNALRSSPVWGGAFRQTLERAAAMGADDLLSTHVALTKADPGYLASVGLADETPDAANQYAVKADQLSAVEQAAALADARIDNELGAFLGKPGRPSGGDLSAPSAKDFVSMYERLTKLVSDPNAMAEAVNAGDLMNVAPATAGMLSATATKAIQYLHAVAPKNPRKNAIPALDLPWAPSALELTRWGRRLETVQNPERVLTDLRQGTLTFEQVDTLRVVYPEMLGQIQQRMMERLAGYEKTLGQSQRLMLSRLFGAPVGGAGDPKGLALIQGMHKATMAPAEMSPPDGRQNVSVTKNYETQSQRIESRGMA